MPFTLQRTFSERKTGVERKIFSLPYNQRTLFRALSGKSFEVREARTVLSLQKVLSLFNGQNDAERHGFVVTRAKKKRLPLRQALGLASIIRANPLYPFDRIQFFASADRHRLPRPAAAKAGQTPDRVRPAAVRSRLGSAA